MLFILLQAAIGLGILMYGLAVFLLVVVFPGIWLVTSFRAIQKAKKNNTELDKRTYASAALKGFLYGILALVVISVFLFIFIYLFVDLTIS